jgi:uncharacterized protein (TIGR02757 family)
VSNLRVFLNQLVDEYHQPRFLSSDPLEFVHHYKDPWDQEGVALLSAVLAYGNVKQIRKSIQGALNRMSQISESPRDFVQKLSSPKFEKKAHIVFEGYVHRFNQGSDLVTLFSLMSRSWSKHGSLGNHFLSFLDPKDEDIGPALSGLIAKWYDWLGSKGPSTFSYLLTSPSDGSCCKRWCMFLRWMGRRDHLDPGLWTKKSKLAKTFQDGKSLESKLLVMPLDTHTGRISQYLGLTSRKSLNWKAALEVTQALKKVDPEDPTRYDFALSRLGILDICQRSYREEICRKCQLLPECQFAKKRSDGHKHDETSHRH